MIEYKKWSVQSSREAMAGDEKAARIAEKLRLFLPTAELLVSRGYDTPEAASAFLGKSTEYLHDPFLMKDIRSAAKRILEAVANGERIMVYGDYDVDGVTSVSSLVLYLRDLGADVDYYIPSRLGEGYGMSVASVKKIAEQGFQLIVTVDTGVTAVEETKCALECGMDIIVTDHHECPDELPGAFAVVNPRRPDCDYPFKELAGVGVVFKLLCAMEALSHPDDPMAKSVGRVCDEYGDLVAIGTVADVMPITDENRLIVSYGLSLMEKSPRPGLEELMNACSTDAKGAKKRITSTFIGFTLSPRLNAAGRLRSASIAVELLLAETGEEAAPIARSLCELNRERQEQENAIVAQIKDRYADSPILRDDPVIVLSDEYWQHGIVGIVSSRITERYGRPSIMISFEKSGGNPDVSKPQVIDPEDVGKGSCRSVPGMHLVDALASCRDLLEKFGGHELAAGLSVKRKNLDEFRRRINEYAASLPEKPCSDTSLGADCELALGDVTLEQAEELYRLEPFGVSNPAPVFVLRGVKLLELSPVGGGRHLRLSVGSDDCALTAMYFRKSLADIDLYPGDTVDVMFNLEINTFLNVSSVQLIVRDIHLTDEKEAEEQAADGLYHAIAAWADGQGDAPVYGTSVIPDREDFIFVFRLIRKELALGHTVYSLRALKHLIASLGNRRINRTMLQIILQVLDEKKVLEINRTDKGRLTVFRFRIPKTDDGGKTDLTDAPILQKLTHSTEYNKPRHE